MTTATKGTVIELQFYKVNRPFFRKPMRVHLGNPIMTTYTIVKNIVFRGKQILLLQQEDTPDTILLAEANIQDGQLRSVLRLPEELLKDVKKEVQSLNIHFRLEDYGYAK